MELPLPRQKSGWGGSSGPSRTVPAGGRGGQAPLTHGCLPASGLSFPVCVVSGWRGPGGPGGSASLRPQRGASSPDRPSCVRLPPGPRRCRPDACPGPGPACPREPWAGPRPRPRACCRLWSLCSWELGVSWWLPIHSLIHSVSQSFTLPNPPRGGECGPLPSGTVPSSGPGAGGAAIAGSPLRPPLRAAPGGL